MLTILRPSLLLTAVTLLPVSLLAQQLEIVEAAYGSVNFQMNVTPKLRGMIQNNVLDVAVDPGLLGGDPAPGAAKVLRVVYRYGGRQYETTGRDFERIRIPAGATTATPAPVTPAPSSGFSLGDLWGGGTASNLRIVSARYGEGNRVNDVRDRLQALVRNDAVSVKVENSAMGGDPAVAASKTLEVVYEYRGTTFQTTVKEGSTLTLPDSNARAVAASTTPAAAVTQPVSNVLRIASARYGGDNRYMDVLARLQGLVGSNSSYSVKVDNATMGGDPAVGKDKVLELTYEWNGGLYSLSAKEGQSMNLPDSRATRIGNAATAPVVSSGGRSADRDGGRGNRRVGGPMATPTDAREIIPIGRSGGLRIFYARYGVPGQEVDVREQLRPMLQPEALSAVVGVGSMGSDPAPGVFKTVTVLYEFRGRTYEKSAGDGQTLVLP